MLDTVERDTWYFFKEHYLTMTDKYSYHQPHFVLLEQNETEKDRKITIKFEDFETTRDYEKILKLEFDNDIMSEHFGNYQSLSI